ncbi:MAG: ABC transporter permease [Opitutales bacterium]|nr:ABC transporter permease [Opitutales bacterium]NRA28550.1 ABC transporter permease [Opitutales bacterium]
MPGKQPDLKITAHELAPNTPRKDPLFLAVLAMIGGSYVILIALMLAADVAMAFQDWEDPSSGETHRLSGVIAALNSPELRYATGLSIISSSIAAILAVWVATPLAYLMSRFKFPGKPIIDALIDIPIILPPLVIGLLLLMLFNFPPFEWMRPWVVFEVPGVVLAQFVVACAFATRSMRVAFDQIPQRFEDVAITLGASRAQTFFRVILPQANRGILAAGTLAWARSLGEFGPILIFAGSTRMKTEVLPTSVFLEMQSGNLQGMLAISLLMILCAIIVLTVVRGLGGRVIG